jgi:hypothetical protein
MSKLWHNWWIVGLANWEIDAMAVWGINTIAMNKNNILKKERESRSMTW